MIQSQSTHVALTSAEFPKETPVSCCHIPQTPGSPEGSQPSSLCHGQVLYVQVPEPTELGLLPGSGYQSNTQLQNAESSAVAMKNSGKFLFSFEGN